jgi:hypothetical protein
MNCPSFSSPSDPLVHHGRHFGRTVHAMVNVPALITNSIVRMAEDPEVPEEDRTPEYTSFFSSSCWADLFHVLYYSGLDENNACFRGC